MRKVDRSRFSTGERVSGWFVASDGQATFRTGCATFTMDLVESIEHARRGIIVKGQTSVVDIDKNPHGTGTSSLWWVNRYLVPRQPERNLTRAASREHIARLGLPAGSVANDKSSRGYC